MLRRTKALDERQPAKRLYQHQIAQHSRDVNRRPLPLNALGCTRLIHAHPGLVNAAGSPRMWPKFRLFVTRFERQAVVHRKRELYDHAYLAGRVGRLHYHRLAYRRASGAGKTMQYSTAYRFARALVVSAP